MHDPYFTSHSIFFKKILNNRYLAGRVYLTQKPCSHPENSLPPASRKSHIEESREGVWEAGVSKKLKETPFSMIYTTFEQMKGLVLVFYLGCLGGIFYFLESSREVGLPFSKPKTGNHDLGIRATPHYTICNQYSAHIPTDMFEVTLLQASWVKQWLHSRNTQHYQEQSTTPSFNLI